MQACNYKRAQATALRFYSLHSSNHTCSYTLCTSFVDLTTYDTVKQTLLRNSSLQDNAITHSLSRYEMVLCVNNMLTLLPCFLSSLYILNSACSGVVSATLGTPADVIKTRMMNQPFGLVGKRRPSRSTLNCLVQTVRD